MVEEVGFKVGDQVRQLGKSRRSALKVTRVSPGGRFVICVPVIWDGRMFNIRADRLRKVADDG